MFRTEFLKAVWKLGRTDIGELAFLLETTEDLIRMEAQTCAEMGSVKVLDSLIFATPFTDPGQTA